LYNTVGANSSVFGQDSTGTFVGDLGTKPIYFYTNSAERMRLDASGNLGLGVTPSASTSNYRTLEIGGGGVRYGIFGQRVLGSAENFMGWNAYGGSNTTGYGTGFYYKNSGDGATMYSQTGFHSWFVAPSGTAGDAISFTQAMTLDASGNLALGQTSSSFRMGIRGSAGSTGYTECLLNVGTDADVYSAQAQIRLSGKYGDAGYAYIAGLRPTGGTATDNSLVFGTVATERMRLDSSGNLGLGVTPSAWSGIAAAMQLADYGTIASKGTVLWTGTNFYYDAGEKYVGTGAATRYAQESGAHKWLTAPSGTAGNAISFTQAMTLDANGAFFLGGTNGSIGFGGGTGFLVQSNGQMSNAVSGSATNLYHQRDTSGNFSTFWYGAISSAPSAVGSISTDGTLTAYNTSSDYRLKNITGPITNSGAYIDSLNPVEGTWKADGSTFVGLIAHEVQEASRTNVATGVKDGEQMQGMDYSSAELIANMLAELKSLRARVAALESI
jgi:hypothetical protein